MIVFNAFSKGNFLPYCSGDEKWQVKVWAELVCSEASRLACMWLSLLCPHRLGPWSVLSVP